MNYNDDIQIDETSLDVEWLLQPGLMMKYARHAAQAELEHDRLKEALDVVKAELDNAIRTDPEAFGIGKVTEAAITGAIILHSDYKDASERYLQGKFEFTMAKNALRAFEQRKEALENLVKLHGQQYFAGPKVPRDLTWEMNQKQQMVDNRIAQRLTRKKV